MQMFSPLTQSPLIPVWGQFKVKLFSEEDSIDMFDLMHTPGLLGLGKYGLTLIVCR